VVKKVGNEGAEGDWTKEDSFTRRGEKRWIAAVDLVEYADTEYALGDSSDSSSSSDESPEFDLGDLDDLEFELAAMELEMELASEEAPSTSSSDDDADEFAQFFEEDIGASGNDSFMNMNSLFLACFVLFALGGGYYLGLQHNEKKINVLMADQENIEMTYKGI